MIVHFFFAALLEAGALLSGPSSYSGVVKSFDTQSVVLEAGARRFRIPRQFVGRKHLKTGERLELVLSLEQARQVKVNKVSLSAAEKG